MKQNGLTIIVPIRNDKRDGLEIYFTANKDAIYKGFSKSLLIHSANFTILPPASPQKNIHRLLFTCNYDGGLKSLLLNSGKRGNADHINEVFKFCENYQDGSVFDPVKFELFVKAHSIYCNIFLFAFQGVSRTEIMTSDSLRSQIDHILDGVALATFPKFSQRIKRGRMQKKQPSRLKRWLMSRLQSATGIREGINDPTESVKAKSSHYESEDVGTQNRLTVIVPIKTQILNWRRLLMLITMFFAQKNEYNGKLGLISGLATVHFARWAFIDGGWKQSGVQNLLFEANYDGSFESYIDDFVDLISKDLNCLWGHCAGFPKRGSKDIEAFKAYIRQNQILGQISYQAYPDLTISNILTNLSISGISPYNRQQGLQRFFCGSYQA